jgi:hypothetical protein
MLYYTILYCARLGYARGRDGIGWKEGREGRDCMGLCLINRIALLIRQNKFANIIVYLCLFINILYLILFIYLFIGP